ncbi:MAG TPA: hypothetical protein VGB30_15065 [bacterium]|jgi:hypothetical protein
MNRRCKRLIFCVFLIVTFGCSGNPARTNETLLGESEVIAIGAEILSIMLREDLWYLSETMLCAYHPDIYNLYSKEAMTDLFFSERYWVDIGRYPEDPENNGGGDGPTLEWINIILKDDPDNLYSITDYDISPIEPAYELRKVRKSSVNDYIFSLRHAWEFPDLRYEVIGLYHYGSEPDVKVEFEFAPR